MNKDGLKDIIIIAADNYDGSSGEPISTVYLQKADDRSQMTLSWIKK